MLKRKFWLTLIITLGALASAACGTLSSSETRPTIEAEVTALIDEATRLASTQIAAGTQTSATAVAAATYVANMESINRGLAVTLRAAIPPTQQVVLNQGPVTPGMNAPLEGAATQPAVPGFEVSPDGAVVSGAANQFTQIATAAGVRESDGCASSYTDSFSVNSTRIYATTRVLNIVGGTSVSVQWFFEGQAVASSTPYTVPQNDPDFCLWFYLEPADTTFQVGNWSVQFFADGVPQDPAAAFTMN